MCALCAQCACVLSTQQRCQALLGLLGNLVRSQTTGGATSGGGATCRVVAVLLGPSSSLVGSVVVT